MYAIVGFIGLIGIVISMGLLLLYAIKKRPKKYILIILAISIVLFGIGVMITKNNPEIRNNNETVPLNQKIIKDTSEVATFQPDDKLSFIIDDPIDEFVSSINSSGIVKLEFVEDFVPSDNSSGHYRTAFRLHAYKDAKGKSFKYEDTTVDIILSSKGAIERIYMDGATFEQCENMIRYASPLLDSSVTDTDIQETVDYITKYKEANGYYYSKLGLCMLGGGNKGYDFMLKRKE